MLKPQSLRDAIVAFAPELAQDPERLRIWVDRGTLRSTQAQGHGFEYAYNLSVLLIEWAHHPSVLMMAVLDWVRRHQPDLIASNAASGFTFEADILDNKTTDIELSLRLTEAVTATRRTDGGWDLQHREEPATLFPDDEPIEPSAPRLDAIHLVGEPGDAPVVVDGGHAEPARVVDDGASIMRRLLLNGRSAADWASDNPVLLEDEPGFERDTGRLKFGDGVTPWTLLPYFGSQGDQWQAVDW